VPHHRSGDVDDSGIPCGSLVRRPENIPSGKAGEVSRYRQTGRDGFSAREVDIYDFLLRGDITHDVRLSAGDTVVVPVKGPLLAGAGAVRRQAIYELRQETPIGQSQPGRRCPADPFGAAGGDERRRKGSWFSGDGDGMDTRVVPGDSIVVPENLVYTRLMKDVKDITRIRYRITAATGVPIVAF
jgi:hypothetical protein